MSTDVSTTFATAELVSQEDRVRASVQGLRDGGAAVYSSITGTDFESKKLVAAAVQGAESLGDNLGKTIALRHVVVQAVEINDDTADQTTGEVKTVTVPRIILVQEDGTAFYAISTGIFKAVENLIGVLGQPSTWPEAVNVKALKEGKAPRAYYTLKFA